MNESMTHPMSTVLKGENMAPEPATYAWPGEDPVPLATTQFPNPLITIAFFAVHDRLLRYLKWILH